MSCPYARNGRHVWYSAVRLSRVLKRDWCIACGHPRQLKAVTHAE